MIVCHPCSADRRDLPPSRLHSEMIIFRVPFVWPGTFRSFCYLILSGLLGFLGQTLLSVGLQGEKVGRGSLVMYLQVSRPSRSILWPDNLLLLPLTSITFPPVTQVIFSGVVDRLAFVHPHRLSILSFLGSLIIVLSAVFGTVCPSSHFTLILPTTL